MREHFRSFDSKISFFAFADIITAVSGMLIFITLLLATDLGRPTNSEAESQNSELERQLKETLARQANVDAKNQRLQGLLVEANTAPDPDKLQSDISRLRTELAEEKSKHAGTAEELADSKSAMNAQDKYLGITDVRERIQKEAEELSALNREESNVGDEIAALKQQITSVQTKILKLRSREGQVWLIPDRKNTTKEPILVTVSGSSLKIERFDHPELAQQFSKSHANGGFESYLKKTRPQDQYVVFLIRPSGIGLFKNIVQTARDTGFEVGFDALEEDREVHFTRPPPIDDEAVPASRSGGGAGQQSSGTATGEQSSPGDVAKNESSVGGGSGAGSSEVNQSGTRPLRNQAGSAGTNISGGTIGSTIGGQTNGNAMAGETNGSPTTVSRTNSTSARPAGPPVPKPKGWWQRFLEWIGLG